MSVFFLIRHTYRWQYVQLPRKLVEYLKWQIKHVWQLPHGEGHTRVGPGGLQGGGKVGRTRQEGVTLGPYPHQIKVTGHPATMAGIYAFLVFLFFIRYWTTQYQQGQVKK